MDRKKIISTTRMFVIIVLSIIVFKSIFGEKNTLVGVAGITAMLSLLGTDYTINPIKNTFYFVFIEVGLGIAAYLASTYEAFGPVITFFVIFMILYSFTYNTKKPTYVAFTLGYFFMLYTPVTQQELPMRLAGLLVCGLAIMIKQLTTNKNRLYNESKAGIKNSIKAINEEINSIMENEGLDTIDNININTYKSLRVLVEGIYTRIDNNVQLPEIFIQYLYISQALESINLTIGKMKNESENIFDYSDNLNEIKEVLIDIDSFMDEKITIDDLILKLKKFIDNNKDLETKDYFAYELKEYLRILKKDLKNTLEVALEDINPRYKKSQFIDKLEEFKKSINRDSLKFTFAFRGALVTGLGVLIVNIFDLEYGKWLMFSMSAIVQPYLETGRTKGIDRIIGTVLGLILFRILFSIFTDSTSRLIIIMSAGYINNYLTKYSYQMICTTISALGAASIVTDINQISFDRILFVILGTLIALFGNRIILPYRMSDVTKKEVNTSIKLNQEILNRLSNVIQGKTTVDGRLKWIISANELLNKKIFTNNATLLSNNVDDFLYNQRVFMNEVRSIINNLEEYSKVKLNKLKLFYNIELIEDKNEFEKEILEHFKSLDDNESKLLLIDVLEINRNIAETSRISQIIEQEI